MDIKTGKPDHINDVLARLHRNSWYEYTSKEQVYANLRLAEKIGVGGELIDNPVTELPSEEVVNAKLKEMQDEWDLQNDSYKSNRREEYPSIEELVVALYDSEDKTAVDEKRAAVKLKYPKP